MKVASEKSLISVDGANSFSVSNITMNNVTSVDDSDSESVFLKVGLLNVGNSESLLIEQIKIANSSISLIDVQTLTNTTADPKSFVIRSVEYLNSIIATKRVLISTKGFSMDSPFSISISELKFENIEFLSSGSLVELMHQLPINATLEDSVFF